MKILPIGSVVKFQEAKLMIVGHFSKTKENKNQYYYVVVPYPIGFAGQDRTLTVEIEKELEVLHEGYQTARGEKYTTQLEKLAELSPAKLAIVNHIAAEAMKRATGGKE